MIDNWWKWKIKTNIDNLEPEDFPHINDLKVEQRGIIINQECLRSDSK